MKEEDLSITTSRGSYVVELRSALPYCLWMPAFLRALKASRGNVSASLVAVPEAPCRATLYEYRRRNEPFREEWERVIAGCGRRKARVTAKQRGRHRTRRPRVARSARALVTHLIAGLPPRQLAALAKQLGDASTGETRPVEGRR